MAQRESIIRRYMYYRVTYDLGENGYPGEAPTFLDRASDRTPYEVAYDTGLPGQAYYETVWDGALPNDNAETADFIAGEQVVPLITDVESS